MSSQRSRLQGFLDLDSDSHNKILEGLQGNILKGHGRKRSAGVFVALAKDERKARKSIAKLTKLVWSALRQNIHS